MVTKDQRRRQLAREKFERQQERRVGARNRARQRNTVIAVVVAVVLAAGATAWAAGAFTGDSKQDEAAAKASPSAAASSAPSKAPDPCAKPAEGAPGTEQWKKEPAVTVDAAKKYTFDLQTTCGDIALDLDAKNAPHTVNSFAFLAGKGYFDHTKCHRLTTSGIYVLQCGDPTGSGSGGPGYTIPDENLKATSVAKGTYPAGTVAMANTGQPHTGGSQFFLVYQDSPLPPTYTPFGTITADGMAVLKKIAAAGDSTGAGDGAPNATVVINKATVSAS
ncbi:MULTISPECIES: peptidylprolyl isomerase [unclassified Streptomyces]|uniref:peptidylprolyl isomerase n=1 Tax=unclassified Streptomyces TaxID=2593676 RepID=UPI003806F05B